MFAACLIRRGTVVVALSPQPPSPVHKLGFISWAGQLGQRI